jgi:hypothetical protein
MEQRRLRLGDILDDYCPRERRVTNHAVVAMVEETVKQTRCSTCDTEHPYKGGHAPRRKKKETSSALYKEVLAGKPDTDLPVHAVAGEANATDEAPDVDAVDSVDAVAPAQAAIASDDAADDADTEEVSQPILSRPTIVARREVAPEPPAAPIAAADGAPAINEDDDRPGVAEEGPVHRQLIRAQLPRIEGQKEERRPTDFTIRQPGGRGGNQPGNQFRGGNDRMRSGGRGGPAGNGFGNNGTGAGNRGNGHRPHGQRFAGARSGQGQGPGQGQGQGRGQGGGFRSPQQPRQGGGRKRSR